MASYQFQKQFFKPFEAIMLHNPSPDTRELIVQCLERMIASRVHNIKSGWKAVFVVLGIAARQSTPPLVHSAFDLLLRIMEQYFALITESSSDTMDECVNCLVAFGCNPLTDVAQKAIHRLQSVADFLGQQVVTAQQAGAAGGAAASTIPGARKLSADVRVNYNPSIDPAVSDSAAVVDDAGVSAAASKPAALNPHSTSLATAGGVNGAASTAATAASSSASGLRIWFLLLTGLSRLVGDSRLAVRSAALESLFAVLNAHGALFSAATWRHIFYGVLFPIFGSAYFPPHRTHHRLYGTAPVGAQSVIARPHFFGSLCCCALPRCASAVSEPLSFRHSLAGCSGTVIGLRAPPDSN